MLAAARYLELVGIEDLGAEAPLHLLPHGVGAGPVWAHEEDLLEAPAGDGVARHPPEHRASRVDGTRPAAFGQRLTYRSERVAALQA
eukprot:8192333-Alexandrium_andersonii.AAC.1